VTGLIAKIGDRVKRGDPLFEIDSPEVVQPQNDYIAAVTALNKARSALDLARIVEKRLKDLYEGKAAPLKEWQAAEAALVAAQNDLRSGEITLEATRSRLRIVGFTDEEIASLQAKGSVRRAAPIHAPIDGTIISRKVGPGQYVRNDTGDALYVIADLSTIGSRRRCPRTRLRRCASGRSSTSRSARCPAPCSRRASPMSARPPTPRLAASWCVRRFPIPAACSSPRCSPASRSRSARTREAPPFRSSR
jgi:cobalt-zinc-cadmium efflux system membrane fusion protein